MQPKSIITINIDLLFESQFAILFMQCIINIF